MIKGRIPTSIGKGEGSAERLQTGAPCHTLCNLACAALIPHSFLYHENLQTAHKKYEIKKKNPFHDKLKILTRE